MIAYLRQVNFSDRTSLHRMKQHFPTWTMIDNCNSLVKAGGKMVHVVPIVEGHGEVEAVPVLLRRIAEMTYPRPLLKINHPIRVKIGSFLKDDSYFKKQVTLAAAKAAQSGGFVLILLDCEDDCPAIFGPQILEHARAVRSDVNYVVVLAYREYESWFLAAAPSLRGIYGFPLDLEPPADVEAIRDAKGWLGSRMDRKYDVTTHQLELRVGSISHRRELINLSTGALRE
jgi:hypothetical protein